MRDVGSVEWSIVVFLFLLMFAYNWFFGQHLYQLIVRLVFHRSRATYRKWGVEKQIFQPVSNVWFAVSAAVIVLFTGLAILGALFSTVLITGKWPFGFDQLHTTSTLAFSVSYLSFFVEMQRTESAFVKVRRLNRLRDVFHTQLAVTELLSVYESLRSAPDLYWEEFSNLSDERVNGSAVREYMTLSDPFRHSQSLDYHKIVIALMVLTIAIGIIAAIGALDVIIPFLNGLFG